MSALIARAYEDKVLSPEHHGRLVQNIEHFAETAGIPVRRICETAKGMLSAADLKIALSVRDLMNTGVAGWMLDNQGSKSIEVRMQAMTGLFVRNFLDARMMVLGDVLDDSRRALEPSVLLIPNFAIAKKGSRGLTAWQTAELHGTLVSRHARGKFTVIYTRSLDVIASEYGQSLADHVRTNYVTPSASADVAGA